MRETVSVETTINAPMEKVWPMFNDPAHVTQWNAASPDWHTPKAQNDLKRGGRFTYRMEAKDGSFGFDMGGMYDEVLAGRHIAYTMDDGRKVQINFSTDPEAGTTTVAESFEAEDQHPLEMQRGGWQAILDNFKRYVEREAGEATADESKS